MQMIGLTVIFLNFLGAFTLTSFVLSQTLAASAILADAASFQFKSRKSILCFFVLSTALLSLHYFVLGDQTAGALFAIAALRNIVAYFYPNKTSLILFLLLSILSLCLTYSTPFDIVALMASLCATIAPFQRTDLRLRLWSFAGSCFWLVFNLWLASPIAVLHRCIFFASNVMGLWRFYRNKIVSDREKDNPGLKLTAPVE